jgi:hypothetical protein
MHHYFCHTKLCILTTHYLYILYTNNNFFLNSIDRLFSVMKNGCVFCEVETAVLCHLDKTYLYDRVKHISVYSLYQESIRGRDSSVGIATRYGLEGRGIESRWGRDFLQPFRPALGPTSLLYNGFRVFLGGKAAGVWRWTPTPSSAEVKERL